MAETMERLNAALTGRYVLERRLGQGGMAFVYLARDLRHNRPVAIKVLRPDLAAALGPERFLREIEIAAGLTHPHILPVFDSGDADGFLYYVMPFVEGESLRDRLTRERQLPIEDALQVTREVADALGAAHSRGIVHRDIKPENILFQGGHAVVADFGIARAVSAAGGSRITETGLAIGTPAYMSPEQAAGEREVDGRSDLYSLACVTYEMLIGHPPYSGISAMELFARHTSDPVPPLRTVRETIPPHAERAIARALAKMPPDRFPTAAQFINALTTATESSPAPARTGSGRRVAIPARVAMALAAAVIAIAAAVKFLPRHASAEEPTVVVLRPQHVPSPDDEWFADGIADEISNRLTRISGLRVIARQTATRFATSGQSLREFGDGIGAGYAVVLGLGYDRTGGDVHRVRVSAQLVSIRNSEEVWGESYTDTVRGQVFDLQADIAEHVARALDVTVLGPEREALRARPTDNDDAYEAYLRANRGAHGGYLGTYSSASDRRAAIDGYLKAVTLDPEFAEAHARLAVQYALLAGTTSELAQARDHADRAVNLRPGLALAHLALALCAYREGDLDRLRREAAQAERLGANSAETLEATATLYDYIGAYEMEVPNYERAFVLDPLSWETALDLGVGYFALHRNQEADRQIDRAIALDSTQPDGYMYKAWLYLSWRGSVPAASAVLQTAVRRIGDPAFTSFINSHWWVSRIMARDGWYRGMLERTALEPGETDGISRYSHLAALAEGLGQRERATADWDSAAAIVRERLRPGLLPTREAGLRMILANALAGKGERQSALDELGRASRLSHHEGAGALGSALVYAQVGDAEQAAIQFERVMRQGNWVTPTFLSLDPTFEPLRGNPRFARLLGTAARSGS